MVTVPGEQGALVAFLAELGISFVTMFLVLIVSNSRYGQFTGLCVGCLIVLYITFEAPLSGFSMNPARTLASALPGGIWSGWWIYVTAPFLGMLAAAQVYLWLKGRSAVRCAKLHHQNNQRCIFCESRAAPATAHQSPQSGDFS